VKYNGNDKVNGKFTQKFVYIKICSGGEPASFEIKISFPNQEMLEIKSKDQELPVE